MNSHNAQVGIAAAASELIAALKERSGSSGEPRAGQARQPCQSVREYISRTRELRVVAATNVLAVAKHRTAAYCGEPDRGQFPWLLPRRLDIQVEGEQ